MAHKKGAGSSKNGRESHSKRLGIKIFGGQDAIAGNIIVRQRGTKHHPDKGVGIGKDHTLFALIDGTVVFRKKANAKSYVSIVPAEAKAEKAVKAPKAAAPKAEAKAEVVETPVAEAATEVKAEKTAKAPAKKAAAPKAAAAEKAPKKAAAKADDSKEAE